MIIDGRRLDDTLPTDYDLVIVGAGPAGIAVAQELGSTGLKIALLESGGEEYDDAAQDLNEGLIEGNDDEYDLVSSRLRFLGGTSNHWGGHCTPLDPLDFERSWAGFSGWPFARAALDPFYERAHDYCDLGAYTYDLDALVPDHADRSFLAENPDLQTAVLRQSTPTRFGEKYRAAMEASETVHLWLWTNATGVSTTSETGEWVDTKSIEGPDRRFTARAVVLAPGAIEVARLLLWANAQNQTEAGNAGGLLGRCYMDHSSGGAAFVHFDKPQADRLYWADIDQFADNGTPLHFYWRMTDAALKAQDLPNFHYIVIPFADEGAARERRNAATDSLGSLKQVVRWGLGMETKRGTDPGEEYCSFVTQADDLVVQTAITAVRGEGFNRALLKYESEERPDRENGVLLGQDKDALGMPLPILRWSTSQDDIAAIKSTAGLFGQYVGAGGLGRVQMEDHDDDPFWGVTTSWHQLGVTRMSDSPSGGVVDADCRVHGAGELYVASGGVFPQVGRANPTLTIVALSLRLADHLKGKLAA